MKQVPIKLGPLALLLTVISICLTTLSILNLTTAQADLRLAQKYADTVRIRYTLETEGQEFLQEAEEAGPSGLALLGLTRDADGIYWKTLEKDGARLRIGLDPTGEDGIRVVSWRQEKEWNQDQQMNNLWMGFN